MSEFLHQLASLRQSRAAGDLDATAHGRAVLAAMDSALDGQGLTRDDARQMVAALQDLLAEGAVSRQEVRTLAGRLDGLRRSGQLLDADSRTVGLAPGQASAPSSLEPGGTTRPLPLVDEKAPQDHAAGPLPQEAAPGSSADDFVLHTPLLGEGSASGVPRPALEPGHDVALDDAAGFQTGAASSARPLLHPGVSSAILSNTQAVASANSVGTHPEAAPATESFPHPELISPPASPSSVSEPTSGDSLPAQARGVATAELASPSEVSSLDPPHWGQEVASEAPSGPQEQDPLAAQAEAPVQAAALPPLAAETMAMAEVVPPAELALPASVGGEGEFRVGEVLRYAWQVSWKRFWALLGLQTLVFAVSTVLTTFSSLMEKRLPTVALALQIVYILLAVFFQTGLTRAGLFLARDQGASLAPGRIFRMGATVFHYLVAMALSILALVLSLAPVVLPYLFLRRQFSDGLADIGGNPLALFVGVLGLVVFLVPCMWLMARLSFVGLSAVDQATDAVTALKTSFRITRGRVWPILGLWGGLGAFHLAGLLLLGMTLAAMALASGVGPDMLETLAEDPEQLGSLLLLFGLVLVVFLVVFFTVTTNLVLVTLARAYVHLVPRRPVA